ncbi:MAG: ROK family protein [Eubacterium sp.]|nr:ROK family protein [Eubacterium sp.]MCM1215512.1 ROK family protein [Lachnospiraceae bacterium]MCM1239309.1 ROK family protein [Lachnospiraceae bacterium]
MTTMVLDIGGTAIKSGLYTEEGLSEVREVPTQASMGGAHVVNRAKELIADYRKYFPFQRIGISTAGQVDPRQGKIVYANENIPGYTGTMLKDIMEQEFRVPTAVENDVHAAAIGEAAFGAGRGIDHFVCLTYGTGVGGAIFTDGKLYSGNGFSAGVFGAIVTHPEQRDPKQSMFSGCYEKYASTTALVRQAVERDPSLANGRAIFARLDEPDVKLVVDQWIMEIVYGLITIVHMMDPACVILGGGVMEQTYVLDKIREKLYQNLIPAFHDVKIEKAQLGNRAGMLGAAVL